MAARINRWLMPFAALPDHETAFEVSKGTTWAAIYLALSYLLMTLLALFLGRTPYDQTSAQAVQVVVSLFFCLAGAGLAALSWWKRPRWVAVLVLAWISLEIVAKVLDLLGGKRVASFTGFVLPLILLSYSIGGLRGAFALKRAPASAAVFD